MSTYLEDILYFDEKAIKFGNEELEAILVPSLGSNLLSLKWKKKDIELLQTAEHIEQYKGNPFLYGMPILFPPNRIGDGTFTHKDQTYTFTINEEEKNNHLHGFLYDKPWKFLRMTVNEEQIVVQTEIESVDFSEIKAQFPHPFTVRMTYVLKGSALEIEAEFINVGTKAFPFGFGYHTTFKFPFTAEGSLDQCRITLPVNQRWLLNDRSLPVGELEQVDEELQSGIDLTGKLFDDVYRYDSVTKPVNEAVLTDKQAGIQLRYECDEQFLHWVLFNGNGKDLTGFICPEPYTWVTDAPNLDLPNTVTGLRELQPQGKITLRSKIVILDLVE